MVVGSELSEVEYADLATRWIDRNWAQAAGLRKVNHLDGKDLVGGSRGDYSGIAIPYFTPGRPHVAAFRLRRANPEIDARTQKPRGKYVAAQADRNKIYFPPLTTPEDLQNIDIPILIVEGEFKALAMRRLASEGGVGRPRFIPIALSGVWNWRGTVGKENNSNGVRVAVKGVIPDLDLIAWAGPNAGRNVIIAFDSDAATKNEVRKARHFLSLELRGRGGNVGNLEWNPELGKGPDDWIAAAGPYEVLAAIGKVEFNTATGWQSKLLCTDTGKAKALVENARIALENVPDFAGLALDEFSGRIVRPPGAPWPATAGSQWSDYDSIEFSAWLQRNHIDMGKDSAYDAVQMVAARNRFHPVRNYLEGLTWDGIPRVDSWLVDYVGVPSGNYTLAAGRCWLISAVARIMQPGCKADVALLLIGPEGKRKSTVCRILGEPWFSDNIPDLGEKDAQMHMAGHWILEMGELAALNKAALTTVKSWMSRSEDVYRPAYGRSIIHQPRQCVFIATSNEGEPLKDTTGNRRFLPVEVGDIDTDALARDKDQLWAEAVELYNAGAPWWFTDETLIQDATREQASRVELHVWYDPIEQWCVNREFVTVSEILDNCIRKDQQTRNQADKINVVRCLQAMGWKLAKRRINGRSTKVYLNPEFLES
jgi:predicted P-loop ATPase